MRPSGRSEADFECRTSYDSLRLGQANGLFRPHLGPLPRGEGTALDHQRTAWKSQEAGSAEMPPTPPSGAKSSSTGPLSDNLHRLSRQDAGLSHGWALAATAESSVALTDGQPQKLTKSLLKLYQILPDFIFLPFMSRGSSPADVQTARWDSTPYPANQREPKRTKENRKLNFADGAQAVHGSSPAARTGVESPTAEFSSFAFPPGPETRGHTAHHCLRRARARSPSSLPHRERPGKNGGYFASHRDVFGRPIRRDPAALIDGRSLSHAAKKGD